MALAVPSKPFEVSIEEITALAEQLKATRQKALKKYHKLREEQGGGSIPRGRGRPPFSLEQKINKLVMTELARSASLMAAQGPAGKTLTLNLD